MHVCVIANNFQDDYIYNFVNHLSNKVERLDFIGSDLYDKNKLHQGVVFYNFRRHHVHNTSGLVKFLRIIDYYQKLIRYLIGTPAKVIHVQWLRFDFIEGVIFSALMRLVGKRVIYTAHNALPHHKDSLYYRLLFKLIYLIQNEIIVHTPYIKRQIITNLKIEPKKIHVVAHGVYRKEKNPLITKKDAREMLGLKQSSNVVLFFGKIEAYKGFDILVRSIDLLESDNNFEILVAGKVSEAYKKEFENLVANRKQGKYIFLLKFISEEEMEYCFKAADITVLPYKEASQSGVLFMSYTFGIPVIAPRLGGFPEDVLPAKTGYIFEPNDPESLAAILNQFKEEWEYADFQANEFIIEHANKNYSWDNTCRKLVEIYKM
jgi:glycosyltransferase involved in cell wall biosynthesis